MAFDCQISAVGGAWVCFCVILCTSMSSSPSLRGSMSVKERLALLTQDCSKKATQRKPLGEQNRCSNVQMDHLKAMLTNMCLQPAAPPPAKPKPVEQQAKSAAKSMPQGPMCMQRQLQMQLAQECSQKLGMQRRRKQQIRKMRVCQDRQPPTCIPDSISHQTMTTEVMCAAVIEAAPCSIGSKETIVRLAGEESGCTNIEALFQRGQNYHRVFSFFDDSELTSCLSHVCRVWDSRVVESKARFEAARSVSTTGNASVLKNWAELIRAFPWGRFLGEGGFKDVYEVWCAGRGRREAVSVMDVAAMVAEGEQAVVQQEVYVSFLLSDLVLTKRCPNFVQVYESFLFAFSPPPTIWGTTK